MPDYLARVVAAGMCTSIAVKPPASGPPLLPGHRPSYPAFALPMTDVGQVEGQSMQADVSSEQVVPALPAATSAVNKQVPPRVVESTQWQQQGPTMVDATPTIRAPRALRPTHVSNPVPSQRVNQEVRPPNSSTAPGSLTGTPMPSPATPLPVALSVKEPLDERPTISSLSLPHGPVEVGDAPPMAAPNSQVRPGISHAPDRITKDKEQGVLKQVGTPQMPPAQVSARVPGIHILARSSGTPPMPPAQVSAPRMPPAHPASSRVKLTIGRLDVQVNNRQPAPPTRRAVPVGSLAATDALEQHYVDRFRLMP